MDLQRFQHNQASKIGVLLVNLGTPDSPDRASVRRYLKEFLWDKRVVELFRPAWWLILNLIILNTRPARSARAYRKVWTKEGSPLMVISRKQEAALRENLQQQFGDAVCLELAMRYGSPDIASGLDRLREQGVRQLLVLPLYPQYSASTTASIFDAVTDHMKTWRWLPELRFINHYPDEPAYITALAESVTKHREQHGSAEKLLMSFHGIPQDYFDNGDPYHCECHKTGRLLAEALGLSKDDWALSFQSRLGPKQWLKPYTDHTLQKMAKDGVKSIQVVCPGFSTDCLETLEEIAMENKDTFMEAGGQRYEYIPCLNAEPAHIDMLGGLIKRHISGWSMDHEDPELTLDRARKLGALQ